MAFHILLFLFAAGAYAAVLVERRGREKRAEQLGDRIKSLAEAVGLVEGSSATVVDLDRVLGLVEQSHATIADLEAAVGLVDSHVKEIEARRITLLRRIKRQTYREHTTDAPRDAEAAQWNPKWGVVNGRWTRLDV